MTKCKRDPFLYFSAHESKKINEIEQQAPLHVRSFVPIPFIPERPVRCVHRRVVLVHKSTYVCVESDLPSSLQRGVAARETLFRVSPSLNTKIQCSNLALIDFCVRSTRLIDDQQIEDINVGQSLFKIK